MEESLKTFKKFTGAVNSSGEMEKLFTVVFVKRNAELLMGLKARGFGVGLWNGFGGKVEKNESIEEAAKRELKEECNLTVSNLTHLGVVTYKVGDHPLNSIVHVFTTSTYQGSIIAGEEMNPIKWYKFEDIPYENMWPDTKLWYPYMLAEKYFTIFVKYNNEGKIIENHAKEFKDLSEILDQVD